MSGLLNTAIIRSRINIPKEIAAGQDTNRPLQGQAPYVINAGLFYDLDESGIQINTLFNMVGKNIAFVGNENFRTVYLMPRKLLDLNMTKKIGERFQLKLGISDILNQPMLFIQESGGIRIIQKFRPGQVFSAGLTIRI